MAKSKNVVEFASLLPGKGGRGIKSGLPRLAGTKLGGAAVAERVAKAKTGRIVVTHEQIAAAGAEILAQHKETTGQTVQVDPDVLVAHLVRNMTTAARQAAARKGFKLTVATEDKPKGRQLVIARAE